MERVYNFSAGPSMLPLPVLQKAQAELTSYGNSGQSVMEMSHRSKDFEPIIQAASDKLRAVMNIPDNYKILFVQGGASMQFSMIPLNLKKSGKADYAITGMWSKKAASEASKYLTVNKVASSEDKVFNYIPELDKTKFDKAADYFHITANNTIYGTRYVDIPDTGDVPLVADMSSNILSQVYDVSKFGLIYAGAQKNMGPAGVCIVIIREDLIPEECDKSVPTMLQYKTYADNASMYNTPPTFAIYMCKLVFEWIEELGGVAAIQKINEDKAGRFYDYLDNSKMFTSTVKGDCRSIMNIPFLASNDDLNKQFIKEAQASGFVNLAGHRSVGGMRISIYNAMPVEGVDALIEFMKKFETANL